MNSLETMLSEAFGKLPPLSDGIKETAAKVIPWLILGLCLFGLMAWLGSLQFLLTFSGLAHPALPGGFMLFSLVFAPVIQLLGLYGGFLMLSRRHAGWRFALYSLLAGAIFNLLSFTLVGLFLNTVFAYFLFQIKEFYTA